MLIPNIFFEIFSSNFFSPSAADFINKAWDFTCPSTCHVIVCMREKVFVLNTFYMLEHRCWNHLKTQNYIVLNCGVKPVFLTDPKHGSLTCRSHGPPALYWHHDPTHEGHHPALSNGQLQTYLQKLSQSTSAQQFTSAHVTQTQRGTKPRTVPSPSSGSGGSNMSGHVL